MAHTKSQKAAKGNRDSNPKFLGIKLSGGQVAKAGNIVVKQRGMTFAAGQNAYMSKDFTIHAKNDGFVKFTLKKGKKVVNVVSA